MRVYFCLLSASLYFFNVSAAQSGYTKPFRLGEDIHQVISTKVKLSKEDMPFSQIENWVQHPICFQMIYAGRLGKSESLKQYATEKVEIPTGHEVIFIPYTPELEDYTILQAKVDNKLVFDKETSSNESLKNFPVWNLNLFHILPTSYSEKTKTAVVNVDNASKVSPPLVTQSR